jgi:hypothetical protein
MWFIHAVVSKNFHLFGGVFCFRVAGEVSDLSREARLLLFEVGVGLGNVGVPCLVYWGFSKA